MAKPDGPFNRSWRLLAASFQVVFQNKRLLLFPALSFVFALGIAAFFLLPAALIPTGQPLADPQHWQALGNRALDVLNLNGKTETTPLFKTATYAYLAFFYLLMMACATFWNVAFYNEIIKALAGEAVSLREGVKFARRRIRAILMWSLFAGAVGLLIRALESRSSLVGRMVLGAIGIAWSVASVFVIPVMIREEGTNPIMFLKTSAATLKKTWGEALIGYVGIGFASISQSAAVFGLILLLLAAGVAGLWMEYYALMALAFAGLLLAVIVLGYVVATASHVYRCALYVYATEGVIPAPYTAELMDAAWKVKKP